MITIMNFNVFAATTSLGIIKFIFIISAYLLPYILIPFMIKSLSGVFGNLAGAVNDRSKGLLDRQTKFRQGKRAEKMAAAKNFQRFNGNGLMARNANKLGGVLRNKPTNTYSKGGRATLAQSGLAVQGEADLKNDAVWQANQNDDKFLMAVANRRMAKEKMDKALAKGDTHAASGYQRALDAASQLQTSNKTSTKYTAAMALAKTGYQYSDGEEGYKELRDTMAQFAGGDSGVLGSMMNEAQYHLKNAQRFDLAGINDGAGYDVNSGLKKASLYQLANGKTDSIKTMGAEVMSSAGPPDEKAMVHYKELSAMLPSATGANRDEIVKQMDALESRGVKNIMDTSSGRIDPATGALAVKTIRDKYDATRASVPGYDAQFSVSDKLRGYREIQRPETKGDAAERTARTYERPDPNNL